MKKVVLLGFVLALWSCSQDDAIKSNPLKELNTVVYDTIITYDSPYDASSMYATGLKESSIEYNMQNNTTELIFKIVPYFGFADYDGIEDLKRYEYFDLTSLGYYSPHLIANGKEYGNYVAGNWDNPIVLYPSTLPNPLIYSSSTIVPFESEDYGTHGFSFVKHSDGTLIPNTEFNEIVNSVKLFYVEFFIYDPNTLDANNQPTEVLHSYVKADFPLVSSTVAYSETYPWVNLYNDSFFGEKMIYNTETLEVCIPNTELSLYTNMKQFSYNGKEYQVDIKSNSFGTKIVLDKK